jgi:hypothetical protein
MPSKNQYVVTAGDQWGVRGQGNGKLTSLHDTQKEAIQAARDIAKNEQSELRIQGKDGRFRDGDSYGNDPMPPRDRKY